MNLCLKNEILAAYFCKSKVKQSLYFLPDAAKSLNIFQLHANHLNIITKDQNCVCVCVIVLFC